MAEFSVPASLSNCSLVAAAPEDQYVLARMTVESASTGTGDDWCSFGVFDNTTTGLSPLATQGDSYTLATVVPDPATPPQTLDLTGYGVDDTPPERNGVQQTSDGPYTGHVGTIVSYQVDMKGGNSGSAVEDTSAGEAYAINTHNGCQNSGGSNNGTAVDHPDLQEELTNTATDCADCNDPNFPDNYTEGPCCKTDGLCEFLSEDCCNADGGTIATGLELCDDGLPTDAVCCTIASGCGITSETCCTTVGGIFLSLNPYCSSAPACCLFDGTCINTFETCCDSFGGRWRGDNGFRCGGPYGATVALVPAYLRAQPWSVGRGHPSLAKSEAYPTVG